MNPDNAFFKSNILMTLIMFALRKCLCIVELCRNFILFLSSFHVVSVDDDINIVPACYQLISITDLKVN